MGHTYTANRGNNYKSDTNSLRGANNGAEFEPGTCKSTRRGAKFILNTLNIKAHLRSDVMRSYGISGHFLMVELIGCSSICLLVE
jgi:hypothetical protein